MGPEGVTTTATASTGMGTIVGAAPEIAGVALSPASVSFTVAGGEPVVDGARTTVATIAPSGPELIGGAIVDVQVKVSFVADVADRAQV